MKLERILCPTDFSETSAHAVELATVVAKWYQARITALHVIPPLVPAVPGIGGEGYSWYPPGEAERRQLADTTAKTFQAASDAGIQVDVGVRSGHPARQILDAAEQLPADLIVLGTHGSGGFERLLLGSVAEKVLRLAKCPVMTVPPRARTTGAVPFKHLLCAVDFSDSSLVGLEYALSLAEEADAEITVVHVLEWPWEEPPAPSFEQLPPEQAFTLAAYRREREKDAEVRLAALVPKEAADWCTPATRVLHGKSYVEILRAAEERHADLIVIGVGGRSGLDRAVFGSTTAHVVRAATCPVLTVRR